jgi:hypothetical protein
MLWSQFFFNTFWTVVKITGLRPSTLVRREKIIATAMFVLFFTPNVLLVFATILISDDIDDQVHGMQIIPVLFLIISDTSNFMRKGEKIVEFFANINRLISDAGSATVTKQLRRMNMYFVSSVLLMGISVVINLTTFAVTGKSGIPAPKFDYIVWVIATWLVQATFLIYIGVIFVLLDVFMCSLLFVIAGHFEDVSDRVRLMAPKDVKGIVAIHFEVKT